MLEALQSHWPEYLIEAALLGIFMISACTAVSVVCHPASPVSRHIRSPLLRRAVIGLMMGLTAVALIYSPWGGRSGAHMNPGTTLTFWVLGKVKGPDAVFYILAQFAGGVAGVLVSRAVIGRVVRHESVNYVTTLPGRLGSRAAWIGEFVLAFTMMSMVLQSTNRNETASYTGLFAGLLVAAFITIEAPISGMSMNPARTFGSAFHARNFRGLWIYFTAPPLAMLLAAGLYTAARGREHVYCCKYNHPAGRECIFNCRISEMNPGGGGGIQDAD